MTLPALPRRAGDLVFGGHLVLALSMVFWRAFESARAALRGEAAADVDDIVALTLPALRHRTVLSYRADADRVRDADVLAQVKKKLGI